MVKALAFKLVLLEETEGAYNWVKKVVRLPLYPSMSRRDPHQRKWASNVAIHTLYPYLFICVSYVRSPLLYIYYPSVVIKLQHLGLQKQENYNIGLRSLKIHFDCPRLDPLLCSKHDYFDRHSKVINILGLTRIYIVNLLEILKVGLVALLIILYKTMQTLRVAKIK